VLRYDNLVSCPLEKLDGQIRKGGRPHPPAHRARDAVGKRQPQGLVCSERRTLRAAAVRTQAASRGSRAVSASRISCDRARDLLHPLRAEQPVRDGRPAQSRADNRCRRPMFDAISDAIACASRPVPRADRFDQRAGVDADRAAVAEPVRRAGLFARIPVRRPKPAGRPLRSPSPRAARSPGTPRSLRGVSVRSREGPSDFAEPAFDAGVDDRWRRAVASVLEVHGRVGLSITPGFRMPSGSKPA